MARRRLRVDDDLGCLTIPAFVDGVAPVEDLEFSKAGTKIYILKSVLCTSSSEKGPLAQDRGISC